MFTRQTDGRRKKNNAANKKTIIFHLNHNLFGMGFACVAYSLERQSECVCVWTYVLPVYISIEFICFSRSDQFLSFLIHQKLYVLWWCLCTVLYVHTSICIHKNRHVKCKHDHDMTVVIITLVVALSCLYAQFAHLSKAAVRTRLALLSCMHPLDD